MNPPPSRNPVQPRLVTIVLPARNEEEAMEGTLDRLPLATIRALGLDVEVLVLDGRSTDATAAIAHRWGATVIPDVEAGKGCALRHARGQFRGEMVVMLDADGSYPPDAIPLVLGPLLRQHADVVMGDRRPLAGSMKNAHRVGNLALSSLATLLYARACPDVCTGLWGFRAEALEALPLRSRGFGLEAELFAMSSRLGLRIAHVRTDYLPRRGAAKLSFGVDGLRIVRRLVASRLVPLNGARAAVRNSASEAAVVGGEVGA